MTSERLQGASSKVLIVDDEDSARQGLKLLFERAGFEVIAVGTFAEGRAALAELNPDVLIADIRLGEYNGLQLLATNPRAIPTIIVTGYPDSVLAAEARRLGAVYLVKPTSPSALISIVREKLESGGESAMPFRAVRRWERKQAVGDFPARINDRPARILDVSYGGLRLEVELQAHRVLPTSFTVDFPVAGLSLPVDVVWTNRGGEERWVCGASIAPAPEDTARMWHGVVDAVS